MGSRFQLMVILADLVLSYNKHAVGQPLTIPNGNMESPAVGVWSRILPSDWNWVAGTGVGAVGLTSTGGANGSQQTLYGNQIAGTLNSQVLSCVVINSGPHVLRYWVKRENSGSFSLAGKLLLGGNQIASRVDVIATTTWRQYTLAYSAAAQDVGKSIQVRFVFSNGSGAWQGYLDEVTFEAEGPPLPGVGFAVAGTVHEENYSTGVVWIALSSPATNTITVSHYLSGGTALPGTDFNYFPGTLTFAPGTVSNSFPFEVLDNPTYQAARTVEFRLNNPINARLEGVSRYTLSIVDPEDRPPASTYYIDSFSGNDSNSGTNIDAPWRTLTRVSATAFRSGDRILFRAGGIWTGQLHPLGSGDVNGQATIDRYGSGARPVINAGGVNGGAVYLLNQQYWSINNLEVSNFGSTEVPKKQGFLIKNDCVGTLNSIYIRDCYIHDINGIMPGYVDGKESGGIVLYVTSSNTNVPSKWNDVRIERNTIRDVAREGIVLLRQTCVTVWESAANLGGRLWRRPQRCFNAPLHAKFSNWPGTWSAGAAAPSAGGASRKTCGRRPAAWLAPTG